MNRALIAGLSGVALILTPTLAYAQGTGPNTTACAEANVRVDRAAVPATDAATELAAANAALLGVLQRQVKITDAAADAALAAFQAETKAATPVEAKLKKLADELRAAQADLRDALTALNNAAPPGALTTALAKARAALQVAINAQVAACANVVSPTPVPPTSPPVSPPPSAAPGSSAAPAPRVPGDELDCGDFPLADGRTAQAVLNADPTDPNRLDRDRDGSACEVIDDAPTRADTPDTFGSAGGAGNGFGQVGNGSVPRGGVATGG